MITVSGVEVSPIGIGSYGIGGRGHRDVALTEVESDLKYTKALEHSLNSGLNFTEISLGYGHGGAVRLFGDALRNTSVKREDFFLTHSIYPRDVPAVSDVTRDIQEFYKLMGIGYVDSTLVTQSLIVNHGSNVVYPLLEGLLKNEQTRFVSLSNASPAFVRQFKGHFGDRFIAHEGHVSFEVRAMQDKGVFETCSQLGVENIIWRPLRRNKTAELRWPLLEEIAEKYGMTQNQVVLNWICSLGLRPMVMSADLEHINENIASLDYSLSEGDRQRITDFRPENYNPPPVDWEKTGAGVSIVTLVTDFEQHLA